MHQWGVIDPTHPCVRPFGRTFRIREAILVKIMKLNPFKIQWWSVRLSIYPINSRLRSERKKKKTLIKVYYMIYTKAIFSPSKHTIKKMSEFLDNRNLQCGL